MRANLKVLGNRQFALSVSPFYRYSNKELNANDINGASLFDVPKEHHHYGSSLIANYNTQWLGKPFTLMAMGTVNFSQYGFEDASSMIGGFFSITRNQKTFLGLGVICLILLSAVGRLLMHYGGGPDPAHKYYWWCAAPLIPILLFTLLIFIDASIRNRSVKIGVLSIGAAYTQLFGYGAGFITAWWRRCVRGKDEYHAFDKTFYK